MGEGGFFVGWALWQKMTFVLACAIVAVFIVAYSKLAWTNRLVKKHQIIDEEKRARVQELRRSGQLVEGPRNDVPFGVRAIQSGIEVDGIWISNTNTPVSSELDLSIRDRTSGSTSGGESSKSVNISSSRRLSASSIIGPPVSSAQNRTSPFRDRYNGSAFIEHTETSQNLDPGNHRYYQPRRSSGLRHHDARTYEELALSDPENETDIQMLPQRSHPPRVSSKVVSGASSVADNELNSVTSSDSDGTLEPKSKTKGKGKARDHTSATNADYAAIPTDSPYDALDHSASTPIEPTYMLHSIPFPSQGASWYEIPNNKTQGMQVPYQSRSPSQTRLDAHSPFIPGELHENKVVRKINSGFEVLPAGTFGRPPAADQHLKTTEQGRRESEDSTGPRKGRKLQKKRRASNVSARSRSFHDA